MCSSMDGRGVHLREKQWLTTDDSWDLARFRKTCILPEQRVYRPASAWLSGNELLNSRLSIDEWRREGEALLHLDVVSSSSR